MVLWFLSSALVGFAVLVLVRTRPSDAYQWFILLSLGMDLADAPIRWMTQGVLAYLLSRTFLVQLAVATIWSFVRAFQVRRWYYPIIGCCAGAWLAYIVHLASSFE